MVNTTETSVPSARAAETALAIGYAPAGARDALTALFTLDETLGRIVRTTREPLVGQMRLTWWREALVALDRAPPPAEPLLVTLYEQVLACGVSGADLAAMTDGWDALLDAEIDDAALDLFAAQRGGGLFAAAARVLGIVDARIGPAGEGWALADFSRQVTDLRTADVAAARARALLDGALTGRWPVAGRALGALALLARFDVVPPQARPGSPRRLARIIAHRLVGY